MRGMEFTGRLGALSLSELLQWPHHERRSGSLVVRTARREKRVLFERGLIVGCQSGDPAEYFGQQLLLEDRVLATLGERPRRLDDLYRAVQGSYFRYLEAVYRLLVAGVLDVDSVEEERDAKSEIRMFDLLLEQAAAEEVLFSARHL